jgi:hypothetical protein
MIITRLSFGLGNNLFQYALGRRLALERNTEFLIDFTGENYNRRNYCLSYMSHFNTIKSVAKRRDVLRLKLLNRFPILSSGYRNSFIKENGSAFDESVLNAPKNAYLTGYWQSEKYFKPIENIIRQDLTFKEPQGEKYDRLLDKIKRSDSISVHVRRGDYMLQKNLNMFTTCTPEYFLAAEALVLKKVSSPELFIFSDDIDWVKQNISFRSPVTLISDNNLTLGNASDYQELMLMGACKHNITSNSTYSWWGAWLNNNPQKIVVTPKKWFIDPTMDEKDLIPPEWIKM